MNTSAQAPGFAIPPQQTLEAQIAAISVEHPLVQALLTLLLNLLREWRASKPREVASQPSPRPRLPAALSPQPHVFRILPTPELRPLALPRAYFSSA